MGMEDALNYVARQLKVSRQRASELTGLANDAVEEVLDPDHIADDSPERETELQFEEGQVNLAAIAAKLHLPVSEFDTWTEDEMIFILFGDNIAEGIAAEGPTCLSATANFFCRWYNNVIIKQKQVLLSDGQYHHYNDQGEA